VSGLEEDIGSQSALAAVDPLAFVEEALAARGALVESAGDQTLAVLPPEAAQALGLAEEIRLSLDATAPGQVPCGYGAPLLERLIQEARASAATAWVRREGRPPGRGQIEAATSRLVLRNGLCDLLDVTPGEAIYLAAYFAVTAEADDRYQGMVRVLMQTESGAGPDPTFAHLLDPLSGSGLAATEPRPVDIGADGLERLRGRAALAARELLAGFRAGVQRRKQRDRERIDQYFDGLVADARAPRRAVAQSGIQAKVAHLQAERRQKIRDLGPRFNVRAKLEPAAFLFAVAPVARIRVRLRRRKAEAELILTVPGDSRSPDEPPCAACPRSTLRPVACDDQLHLLCEICAPSAQGRPRCPACAGRR
jgi:hypothetical protein